MPEETVLENPVLRSAENILDRIAPFNAKQKEAMAADAPPSGDTTPPPAKKDEPPKADAATDRPLPSFLETPPAKKEEPKPAATMTEDQWPEKLSGIPDEDKRQVDYKKWRHQYDSRGSEIKNLSAEVEKLKGQVGKPDEATQAKIKELETDRDRLNVIAERASIENHPEFQREQAQRKGAVNAAAAILKEHEVDPGKLEKMLVLRGKSYWDAYEDLASGLPEMAKRRLDRIVGDIEVFDQRRDYALTNSKLVAEKLKARDLEVQKQSLESERKKMESTLEELVTEMRDNHKLEVLQKTTDPKSQWWNDQADMIVKTAQDVLLNSGDMRKLEAAVLLGCSADVYRKLFLEANQARIKAEKELAEINGAQPTIESEVGGAGPTIDMESVEMPIGKAGVEILKKMRAGGS